MNKLVRYWNQNRKQIIVVIAIVVFAFAIIKLLNNLLEQERTSDEEVNTTIWQPNQSVITGEKVSTEITKKNNDMIKQFIDYCNNKDIKNAYNLLSDE